MRPEIAKIIEEDPRVLGVGFMDSSGGFWVDYNKDNAASAHFSARWHGLPRWIQYRTGKRGIHLMLLLDYLLWGINGEFADEEDIRR